MEMEAPAAIRSQASLGAITHSHGIMKMVLLPWITFPPSAKITAYQHHRNQAKNSPPFLSSSIIPPSGQELNKMEHFIIPVRIALLKLKLSSLVSALKRPVFR
jgi:hypothetical protein